MGEEINRNEAIRRALAIEPPDRDGGEVVVTRTINVTDAQGAERTVEFIGRVSGVLPDVILDEEQN